MDAAQNIAFGAAILYGLAKVENVPKLSGSVDNEIDLADGNAESGYSVNSTLSETTTSSEITTISETGTVSITTKTGAESTTTISSVANEPIIEKTQASYYGFCKSKQKIVIIVFHQKKGVYGVC